MLRLLVLLISCVAAFLIGEGLSRVVHPDVTLVIPPSSRIDPYAPNPYIVNMRPYLYFHIPHATYVQTHPRYEVPYRVNVLGFRGPEISSKRSDGLKRLLVVGDSVVEGHGCAYEHSFSALLGRDLRSKGWEVINSGMQGASPIYYASNLRRYLALEPDAILLVLFDNDLIEDRVREATYESEQYMEDPSVLLPASERKWFEASRLFRLSRRFWMMHRRFPASRLEEIIDHNRREFPIIDADPSQQSAFRLSPYLLAAGSFDRAWRMSSSYMDYFAREVRARGGIVLLVTNLSLENLNPEKAAAFDTHARLMDEHVAAWAQSHQVPHVSLVPMMREAFADSSAGGMIIPLDGHPTEEGHRAIANVLRPWLVEQLGDRR